MKISVPQKFTHRASILIDHGADAERGQPGDPTADSDGAADSGRGGSAHCARPLRHPRAAKGVHLTPARREQRSQEPGTLYLTPTPCVTPLFFSELQISDARSSLWGVICPSYIHGPLCVLRS